MFYLPFSSKQGSFLLIGCPTQKKSHSCVPEMTKVGPSTLTDITQSQDQKNSKPHEFLNLLCIVDMHSGLRMVKQNR